MEACPEKRAEFNQIVANMPKDKLVYIDESGIDATDRKQRGWAKIGQVLEGKKSGKCYQRTNIIAGYVNGDTIAPLVFNGSCDTKLVVQWVRECLIKELKPGQIVIMDNAAFHKSDKIKEAIDSVGCRLLYLPAYSPDLNPIEKFWANMKRWIRSNIDLFTNLLEALICFFNAPNAS